MSAGYSGTPLPRKLGIKEEHTVVVIGAPPGFRRTLGRLPDGVRLRMQNRGARDLTIWFVQRLRDLDRLAAIAAKLDRGGLWIAWPKKASGVITDVSEGDVRRAGLAIGLVDFKICAIDATWSGLKFVWRRR